MDLITGIGNWFIQFFTEIGRASFFLFSTIKTLFTTKLRFYQLISQMKRIGVDSSNIILISCLSSGFTFALMIGQFASLVGVEEMVGPTVAWGMTKELAPLLAAIMVCGRSGSSIAAELGTMRITEQIDALKTLCINPMQYLIVPRIVASTIIMPFLTMFAMVFGILGGYLSYATNLSSNPAIYMINIKNHLTVGHILEGLIKSSVFGFIIAFVACYKGYRTKGGAKGVGEATTGAVVLGCILILISNTFVSVLLFKVGL